MIKSLGRGGQKTSYSCARTNCNQNDTCSMGQFSHSILIRLCKSTLNILNETLIYIYLHIKYSRYILAHLVARAKCPID